MSAQREIELGRKALASLALALVALLVWASVAEADHLPSPGEPGTAWWPDKDTWTDDGCRLTTWPLVGTYRPVAERWEYRQRVQYKCKSDRTRLRLVGCMRRHRASDSVTIRCKRRTARQRIEAGRTYDHYFFYRCRRGSGRNPGNWTTRLFSQANLLVNGWSAPLRATSGQFSGRRCTR